MKRQLKFRVITEEVKVNRLQPLGMATLCALTAGLAAVAAGAGVFGRGDGRFETVTSVRGVTYEMSSSGVYAYNSQQVVSEGIGWDVFTLFLVVPAMLLALPFIARGSFRGRLVAVGLLGYFLYQYLEYSVTWAFGPLFPLFIVINAASLAGLVWLGTSVARDPAARVSVTRFPGRAFGLASVMMAALLTMMWAQRIALGLSGDLAAAGLRGETTMVVQAFDLGLMVPTSLFIGALAWRRTTAGAIMSAAFSVTAVAMAAAIVAMLISAGVVNGTLELPPIVIFGAFAAVVAWLGSRTFAALGVVEHGHFTEPALRTSMASRPA